MKALASLPFPGYGPADLPDRASASRNKLNKPATWRRKSEAHHDLKLLLPSRPPPAAHERKGDEQRFALPCRRSDTLPKAKMPRPNPLRWSLIAEQQDGYPDRMGGEISTVTRPLRAAIERLGGRFPKVCNLQVRYPPHSHRVADDVHLPCPETLFSYASTCSLL